MARNSFERISLNLADLRLWLDNPRLLSTMPDENSCFQSLLTKPTFINLVEDISKHGINIEPILVTTDENGDYIVRDGNRRVAALKLLLNPELCPQELSGIKKKIIKYSEEAEYDLSTPIECHLSTNEVEVERYLISKHTGENQGIGQVDWNALMQAAFEYKQGIKGKYNNAYRFLLYGSAYGFEISDTFPISTLDRLPLSDFFAKAGLDLSNIIVEDLTVTENLTNAALKILADIQNKEISVSTKDDAVSIRGGGKPRQYIDKIVADFDVKPIKAKTSTSSANPTPPKAAPSTPTKKSKRTTSHSPEDRSKFISRKLVNIPERFIKEKEIYSQMSKLKSSETPLVCIVMLRVFLESTLKATCAALTIEYKKTKGLNGNTRTVAEKLLERGYIESALRDAVVKLSGDGLQLNEAFFTIKTIQEFVHCQYSHCDKQTANVFWDKLEQFIAKCWDTVEKTDVERE